MTEKERQIVNESISQLKEIMDVTPKQIAKDLVKSALGRSVRTKDPFFWHAGMLMLGLAEARRAAAIEGDEALAHKIDEAIMGHIIVWKERFDKNISYIDDALAGAALVKIFEHTDDIKLRSECRSIAERIYKYIQDAPRDLEETIVYNAGRSNSNVFADGIGQVSMFLSVYARVFGDDDARKLARQQLKSFKKNGMDERSGLPYHGYALSQEGSGCEKKGILSWGRAAGWLIMGLSEYVKGSVVREGDQRSTLVRWYQDLSKTLLTYQKTEGGYGWQVQAVDGHIDTSATGMIVYGLLNGGAANGDMLASSLRVLLENSEDGKVMNALSSCDDFGVHYQTYGNYPWGQGAALAALCVGAK